MEQTVLQRPEILAPAGNADMLRAAVFAGADAVYLGLDGYNARRSAGNFDPDALREAVCFCHARGVAVHVTLNTLVYAAELGGLADAVRAVAAAGADALIVQDLAVIRASTPGILSTTKGYVIQQDSSCTREFKVRHSQDKAAEELNLIVDCGGHVKNISISHRVYGRVSAEMDIRSRQDVSEFVQALQNSRSTVLSNATSGYHYHLVEAASEERLDLIEEQLKKAGFLAPLQPWEQSTGKGNIKL